MAPATIEDALELVIANFRGITDKGGKPYVLHCLRVMLGVSHPLAQQVAVMHDLIEDTDVTLEELRDKNFAEEVVSAVGLLTHNAEDSYAEYVVRLQSNELARLVKLADLRDNYDIDRVKYREERGHADAERIQRYILSYQFLTDKIDEVSYRRQMASLE